MRVRYPYKHCKYEQNTKVSTDRTARQDDDIYIANELILVE